MSETRRPTFENSIFALECGLDVVWLGQARDDDVGGLGHLPGRPHDGGVELVAHGGSRVGDGGDLVAAAAQVAVDGIPCDRREGECYGQKNEKKTT